MDIAALLLGAETRAAAHHIFRSTRGRLAAKRIVFVAVEGAVRHVQGLTPDQQMVTLRHALARPAAIQSRMDGSCRRF